MFKSQKMKKYVEENLMNAQYIDDKGCFMITEEKSKFVHVNG